MEAFEQERLVGQKHHEQQRRKRRLERRPRSVKKRGTAREGGETVRWGEVAKKVWARENELGPLSS